LFGCIFHRPFLEKAKWFYINIFIYLTSQRRIKSHGLSKWTRPFQSFKQTCPTPAASILFLTRSQLIVKTLRDSIIKKKRKHFFHFISWLQHKLHLINTTQASITTVITLFSELKKGTEEEKKKKKRTKKKKKIVRWEQATTWSVCWTS